MRYSILGFNQEKAVELGLDVKDLLLLSYIEEAIASPRMKHIVKDDIAYVWLQHDKIREDLPILDIKERSLLNYITKLESLGLIMRESVHNSKGRGSTVYYTITEKCEELKYDHTQKIAGENERPLAKNCGSDNKLSFIDSKLDNPTTNVVAPTRNIPTEDTSAKTSSPRKKNLYEKCVDAIEEFTEDKDVREALVEYLRMRLEIKGKQFGANTFAGMLKKIRKLTDDKHECLEIIRQAIDRQYLTFYPVKKDYQKDKYGKAGLFNEFGKVVSVRAREEDIVDDERF